MINFPAGLGYRFRDGQIQQGIVLEHGRKLPIIGTAVKFPDIRAIEQDTTFCGVIETAQELDQRRFARAVQANDGQLFTVTDG